MKKVSIIIPIYNVESYLPECLDSILNQTEHNWEAILIDDGSTDTSGNICDRYANKDNRFRVLHKENGGAASAKNAGLDFAEGTYITFIDSDDWVEPNWLERMVSVLESTDADVVECNFFKEYRDRSEVVEKDFYNAGIYSHREYLSFYLNHWTCSLFWTKVFKRDLTQNVRFCSERRCIDDEFYTYKVISNANIIVHINDTLYHYRQRASSAVASQKNRLQITDDALELMVERYNWISKRFQDLRKIYLKHDVEIMFYFARSFIFCDSTRLKFHNTAKFYFKQCLKHTPDLLTLRYSLRLLRINYKKLPSQYTGPTKSDLNELYP